jgi:pilus assembly protein Flp/PilA
MLCSPREEVYFAAQFHQLRKTKMKNFLARLWKEEEGQDLIEYGLLLVLVALLSVTFITTIGQKLSQIFSNAANVMTSAAGG